MILSWAKLVGYDARRYNYFSAYRTNNIDDVARLVTKTVWSPCVWTQGKRKKDHFISADLVAFDFDDGTWTLDDAIDFVANISSTWAIIGTTKSHTDTQHRFRLVMRWRNTITDRRQYEQNVRRLTRALPSDPAVVDAARLFYPCTKIVHAQDGHRLTVLGLEQRSKLVQTRKDWPDEIPPWMATELSSGIPEGGRNRSAFRFALHLKDRGLTTDRAYDVLSAISLPEPELRNTIRSAYRYTLTRGQSS